jgi:hypothetical protein
MPRFMLDRAPSRSSLGNVDIMNHESDDIAATPSTEHCSCDEARLKIGSEGLRMMGVAPIDARITTLPPTGSVRRRKPNHPRARPAASHTPATTLSGRARSLLAPRKAPHTQRPSTNPSWVKIGCRSMVKFRCRLALRRRLPGPIDRERDMGASRDVRPIPATGTDRDVLSLVPDMTDASTACSLHGRRPRARPLRRGPDGPLSPLSPAARSRSRSSDAPSFNAPLDRRNRSGRVP